MAQGEKEAATARGGRGIARDGCRDGEVKGEVSEHCVKCNSVQYTTRREGSQASKRLVHTIICHQVLVADIELIIHESCLPLLKAFYHPVAMHHKPHNPTAFPILCEWCPQEEVFISPQFAQVHHSRSMNCPHRPHSHPRGP